MFNYVSDISDLAHYIIERFINEKDIAVDCTLGNGYDTDFLAREFNKVISFEIQESPCIEYSRRSKENVTVYNDSHERIDSYIKEPVDCIMYNLGFLPGGDKKITTNKDSSLESIKKGIKLLKDNGLMTICIYIGHDEGREELTCIMDYVKTLDKSNYGVMSHRYENRSNQAPMLVVIEKKKCDFCN